MTALVSLTDYLGSVSVLGQLSTLARQLHSDAANPASHKYIAHQLTLLYLSQSLTRWLSSVTLLHYAALCTVGHLVRKIT